jgi:predicted transcriptional regulator
MSPSFERSTPQRLTSMLIRLPPSLANALRELSRRTRIRQSEYLREAVRDLLLKYENTASTAAGAASNEERI